MEAGDVESCFEVAIDLARKAGEIVKDGYEKMKTSRLAVETKTTVIDLVTEYDKKVEDFLFTELEKKFPSHSFIGEETASEKNQVEFTDNPTWVIDPIDGTMNFVHSLPYSAICIALFSQKEVVLGIVYHVALDLMYTAQKGKGAFCNGTKLNVSNQDDLSKSLVIMELGGNRNPEVVSTILKNLEAVQMASHGVRMMGSAALNMCQIAKGAAESYVEFGIHIWDYAASSIIVTEAGGVVVDPSGGPVDYLARRILCACSSQVANSLSKIILPIHFDRDGP